MFSNTTKEWEVFIDGDANGEYATFQPILAGTSPGKTFKEACDNFFNLDANAGVKRFYKPDEMTFWGNILRDKPLPKVADWIQAINGNVGYIVGINNYDKTVQIKWDTKDDISLGNLKNYKLVNTFEVKQHQPVTYALLKESRYNLIKDINDHLAVVPKKKDEPHGRNVQQLVYGKNYK